MKETRHIRNALLLMLALPLLALGLIGCGENSDKPKPPANEHPTQTEHPTDTESPAAEHPTDAEHPAGAEHPAAEHPK